MVDRHTHPSIRLKWLEAILANLSLPCYLEARGSETAP